MIKKRILLIIMILFSFKVNSIEDCKLPNTIFFKEHEYLLSFKPFIEDLDKVMGDIGGNTKILGVNFDKSLAAGALLQVFSLFANRVFEKAKSESISTKDFIDAGALLDYELFLLIEEVQNLQNAYDDKLSKKDINIQEKLKQAIGSLGKQGIVDYLFEVYKPNFFTAIFWSKKLKPIHSSFLNKCLNYIYLYALSFLIEDKSDKRTFAGCMYELYREIFTPILSKDIDRTISFRIDSVFNKIKYELGTSERNLFSPLTLAQNRSALSKLSSTLNALANLKFL